MRTAGHRSVILALLILSIALLFLLPPEPVRAISPIIFDSSGSRSCTYGSGCGYGGPTTLAWSHTVGSGSNRILIVGISYVYVVEPGLSPSDVTSVTYGTASLTLIPGATKVSSSNNVHVELWALQDPPTGTATITVTLCCGTTSNYHYLLFAVAGSASYFNVASTGTPVGSEDNTFYTGLSASESVPGSANDLVVDTVGLCDCTGSAPYSPGFSTVAVSGSGQTQHWNSGSLNDFSGENFAAGGSGQAASGSSVTNSWSLTEYDSDYSDWSLIAVPLTPAATTTTTTGPPIPEYPIGLPILAILMIIGYGLVRRRIRN